MTDLALSFAIRGDLEAATERYKLAFLQAAKESGTAEAKDFQTRLRAEVLEARLGQGIANAWRLDVYPAGSKLSYDPAWFVHSNAATIIEAFTKGERISAKEGALAVPIPGSPAYDLRVPRGRTRVQLVIAKFGPLTPIHTKRGVLMLVATLRGTKDGKVARLTELTHKKSGARFSPTNQARVTVPMFWLVHSVRLEQRLHWPAIAERAEHSFANRVEARLRVRFGEAQALGVEGEVPAGYD